MNLRSTETWTDEHVIDIVRRLRNDLIKDFLHEDYLRQYVRIQYRITALTPVRIEFIKKELKELLITPVDLSRYHDLIEQIKTTDSAALSGHNETLFYDEVDQILKKYITS